MPGLRKTVDELASRTGRRFIIDGKKRLICLVELDGKTEHQRTPWRLRDDDFIADVRAYMRLEAQLEPQQLELL